MKPTTLLMFLKYPEPGRVKTRLAKEIGEEKAVAVYRRLLEYTFDVVGKLKSEDFRVVAMCDPRHPLDDYRDLFGSRRFDLQHQVGVDLGGRLANAFEKSFMSSDTVMVIGTDCATIEPRHFEVARQALQKFDVVIGPSFDGGYYLLGSRAYQPHLFSDIPWSTSRVFDLTQARAAEKKLSVYCLERLVDIDTKDELPPDWL